MRGFQQGVKELRQGVVSHQLPIVSGIALVYPIEIGSPHIIGIHAEVGGDLFADVFDGDDALRPTKTPECSIWGKIGPGDLTDYIGIGQKICIVDVRERATDHSSG